MRVNDPAKLKCNVVELGKQFIQQLIEDCWNDIYIGTKRIHRFQTVATFPATSLPGMGIRFSTNHIEVTYRDEVYVINFNLNPKTSKPEDFLWSSNWTGKTDLMLAVHHTFLQHVSGLLKIGAV